MFNVLTLTEYITDALAERMSKVTFRWKSSESPESEDYHEVKPFVEGFTYDDTTEDGWPTHTPSILVQPVSESGGVWHFVVFICVVHPAIQEIEKTVPLEGKDGIYVHRDSIHYDAINIDGGDGCRKELYRTALLLTEQVALALKRISNTDASIQNIDTSAPSPILPEFPYCSGVVEFDARISQTTAKIDTKLATLL